MVRGALAVACIRWRANFLSVLYLCAEWASTESSAVTVVFAVAVRKNSLAFLTDARGAACLQETPLVSGAV